MFYMFQKLQKQTIKLIIITAVILSQLTAAADIGLILFFFFIHNG